MVIGQRASGNSLPPKELVSVGHRTLLLGQPDAWVHLYIFIDSSKWEWGGLGVGGTGME